MFLRIASVSIWISMFTLMPAAPAFAADGNWPIFRGEGSRGVAEGEKLPLTWSETENVEWKTAIPGLGWASPIVWEDTIFLSSVTATAPQEKVKGGLYFGGERGLPTDLHHWIVYAVDLKTGAIKWQKEVASEVPKSTRHLKNTYASETPATDGEHVYFYFGQKGLFCFDLEGNEIWRKEQGPFKTMNGWGTASSPVVHGDKVIIVTDTTDESFIVARDKRTGELLWRAERDEPSTWATPFIWESGNRTEIITNGLNRIVSYGLDGKELWHIKGPFGQLMIPTPFTAHGLLYVTSGYINSRYRPVFAIRPGASGDISLAEGQNSNEFIAWHLPTDGPYNPSPLVYGDYYYTLLDRGFFTCHDAKTGAEIYSKQRIDPGAAAFTASPWAYRDRIFCLSEDGDTFVIQPGPEFKVIGKNTIEEFSMSCPAITEDRLIIRTQDHLYSIKEGATLIKKN
jgi:outer membrane protein assembly factor BamB